MYSGKSTEMIRLLGRYKQISKSILAINHSLDDRYDKNKIVTHNQQKMDTQTSEGRLFLPIHPPSGEFQHPPHPPLSLFQDHCEQNA